MAVIKSLNLSKLQVQSYEQLADTMNPDKLEQFTGRYYFDNDENIDSGVQEYLLL